MSQPTQPGTIRRFFWLKILGSAVLLFLIAVLGLRVGWGYVWQHRFEAKLQAVRDLGQPIDLADFQPPTLPPSQDATALIRQALSQWPLVPGTTQRITDHDWHDRYFDEIDDPITDNPAYLAACEPALQRVTQIGSASGGSFMEPLTRPVFLLPFTSNLGESRQLARLMEDAAQRAFAAGRFAEGLGIITQMYALADACDQAPVSVIQHLVALSIRALAAGCLEEGLPQITAAEAPNPAVLLALETLQTRLQNEDAILDGARDALYFERMLLTQTVQDIADGRISAADLIFGSSSGTLWPWAYQKLSLPLFFRDGCLILDEMAAFDQPTVWSRYHEFLRIAETQGRNHEAFDGPSDYLYRPILGWLMPALDSAYTAHFQGLTHQRLASAAVALKRFELERGRAASSLESLTPVYLAAVPRDPMDPDGGPLHYLPTGVRPTLVFSEELTDEERRLIPTDTALPLLYSVGRNSVDDGGYLVIDDTGELDDTSRYRSWDDDDGPTDQWFLLSPPPEVAPEILEKQRAWLDDDGGFGGD